MFHTFQGEGVFAGLDAFFIRLYGCPLQCPWCDSAGTWHPNYRPKHIQRLDSATLLAAIHDSKSKTVVITGGEPCIHDLSELFETVRLDNQTRYGSQECECIKIHVETSGAYKISDRFDWVTISPKKNWKENDCNLPERNELLKANEIKLIIDAPEDIGYWTNYLFDTWRVSGSNDWPVRLPSKLAAVWLHPQWGKRQDKAVLNAISAAVKELKGPFRAGWQMHKEYMVDTLDSRSAPLVPLGGVETTSSQQ
jgi:organic radical activating enzyme